LPEFRTLKPTDCSRPHASTRNFSIDTRNHQRVLADKAFAPLRIVVAGLTVLSLLACYPHPHEYTRVPAISGVLLNNGKPVRGATVFVAQSGFDSDDHCQGLRPMGITNDDGHFNIAPVVRLHLFTSILNPPDVVLQTTTVCFQTAAQPAFGMSIIARTNRTMSFSASCDLATPNSEFRGSVSIPGKPRGICTNRDESFR
jgi:hypothetical protein